MTQLFGFTRDDMDVLLEVVREHRNRRLLRAQRPQYSPNVQLVEVTSTTQTEGRYPGKWVEFNPTTSVYTAMDDVWVITHNDEVPETDHYYEAALQRGFENGRPVFAIEPVTGGGASEIISQITNTGTTLTYPGWLDLTDTSKTFSLSASRECVVSAHVRVVFTGVSNEGVQIALNVNGTRETFVASCTQTTGDASESVGFSNAMNWHITLPSGSNTLKLQAQRVLGSAAACQTGQAGWVLHS